MLQSPKPAPFQSTNRKPPSLIEPMVRILVEAVKIAVRPVGIVFDIGPKVRVLEHRDKLGANVVGRRLDSGDPVELVTLEKLALRQIGIIKDRRLLRVDLAPALEHFERVGEARARHGIGGLNLVENAVERAFRCRRFRSKN